MTTEMIKKTIEEFLNKLTVSFDSVEITNSDEGFVFMIRTKTDSQILIGTKGVNLSSLNHVIKKIIENNKEYNHENKIQFMVDVNDYQEKKSKEIKNKAYIMASRVKSFKTDAEMEPMSSYERMLVHSVLANDSCVETCSTGIGKDRHVVIKYVKQDI